MNVKKLKESIEILKANLDGALIASDIWKDNTGTSIAGYNSNPKAVALFDQVTSYMNKALETSGFPTLDKYYLLELKDNALVVVLQFKDNYQWGMLVDNTKVNLGLLLNIAIPEARKAFEEAIAD